MPEMHFRQSKFKYSACGTFTKNKERVRKFEYRNRRFNIQNELSSIFDLSK